MEFIVLIVIGLSIMAGIWAMASSGRAKHVEATGLALIHNYQNRLGIDQKAGKLYVNGLVLEQADVRTIEKNSVLETKSNAWGMQFHKHKRCELTIYTNSLDRPVEKVEFGSDVEAMNIWYARVSAFFDMR